MSPDPKRLLRQNSTPLGLVENDAGREVVRFVDLNGTGCALYSGSGLLTLGPQQDGYRLTMNREGAERLAETLRRWLKRGHLSGSCS